MHDNKFPQWYVCQQGQYYGKISESEPESIDLRYAGDSLKDISLPQTPYDFNKLFTAKVLWPLAAYFYEKVPGYFAGHHASAFVLAIRNYVRWLCWHYPILDPRLETTPGYLISGANEDKSDVVEEALTAKTVHSEPDSAVYLRIKGMASDIVEIMPQNMRSLYFMQYILGWSQEKIAPVLGLQGAPGVFKHERRLEIFLKDEILKKEELSNCYEDDSFIPECDSKEIQGFFIECLTGYIKKKVDINELERSI